MVDKLNEFQPDYAVSPGEVLSVELELRGMTQQELADAVGCTRQTIVALEAGKYTPSLGLSFRIARLFGENLEDIFEYKGSTEE